MVSPEALGDVGGDRNARLADFVAENQLMIPGKSPGDTITALCEKHRLLPDEEIAKRLDLGHAAEKAQNPAVPRLLVAACDLLPGVCFLADCLFPRLLPEP